MAITRESFLKGNEKETVLSFLQNHKNLAFNIGELSQKLKMPKNNISHKLKALKKQRKVLHKKPYWTVR